MPNNEITPVPTGASGQKDRQSRFMKKTTSNTRQFPVSSAKPGTVAYKKIIAARLAKKSSTPAEIARRRAEEARKRAMEGKGTQQAVAQATKRSYAGKNEAQADKTQTAQAKVKAAEAAASKKRLKVGQREKAISDKVMKALLKKKG